MALDKSAEILKLEQSLIQHLLQKDEVDKKVSGGFRRVRSLSISIDTKNPQHPTFSVQIGMSEVVFHAITGMKEKGGCYGIERYIIDWFLKPGVSNEFEYVIKTNEDKFKKIRQEEYIDPEIL